MIPENLHERAAVFLGSEESVFFLENDLNK
jgi:fructose-1,6-bisphosphatase